MLGRFLLRIVGKIVARPVRRRVAAFHRATQNPQEVQFQLLREILAQQADTGFGRDHGFRTIATIADSVPLTGENRVFAKLGLDQLRRAVNPGLKALLEVAQISTKRPPNSTEVAFRIAPRINAAGRMDVARDVIDLFSIKDADQARLLAGKLDRLNAERQEEERRILRSIEERVSGDPALCEAYCIVVDGEGWHRGVIGIAATRVVERYHRP